MIFTCDGATYNSAEMLTYPTGDPQIPMVHMTSDHQRVFVVTVNRWTGTLVRLADALEIEGVARRFGISELLRALPQSSLPEFAHYA